ncbi:putative calcium-binding protein CML18 [Forsythia ovata]|uniref:Calcium-binding protein CML18 n=1 Tax=Forsythia ovata TaxID=205694 RepID=A0ABD1SJG7_9LAMI
MQLGGRELEAMNINSLINQEQSLQEIHCHQNGQPQMSSHFNLTSSHDDFLEQMLLSILSSTSAFTWDVSSVFHLSLTQLELGSLLRSLGLKPSSDKLDSLIQKANKNNNGLVEFSKFVALVVSELMPAKLLYTEEQSRQLFRMFDRDGNMYIMAGELAHSTAKLGHALTAEELTGMIREADTNGDGRISFSEFSQAITFAAFDNSWA